MPPRPNPLQPLVRVAPVGDLNVYTVFEYELDILAQGSPGSNLLSLAYALLPFAGAFAIAIFGTDIPSVRAYNAFVITAAVTGLAGLICLVLGVAYSRSNRALIARIKGRMPPVSPPPPP